MAKRKKKKQVPVSPPRPIQPAEKTDLEKGLDKAERLIARRAYREALNILEDLNQQYPNQADVLLLMGEVFYQLKDYDDYLRVSYRLHQLMPDDPDATFDLAGAYVVNGLPALGLVTYRNYLKRWPHHSLAADAQQRVKTLEDVLVRLQAGREPLMDAETLALHDEVQFCLNTGEYRRGIRVAEKLLSRYPDFIPVRNNLSLLLWLEGNLDRAIKEAQRVLDMDPTNIQALSNLSRYLYLQGRTEEALQYAQRLKEQRSPNPRDWAKQAEALAFLGDDQGVVSLLQDPSRLDGMEPPIAAAFLCHLAASEYRLGRAKQAQDLWRRALKYEPDFPLAIENLENLRKPPHERYAPWSLSMEHWVPRSVLAESIRLLERAERRSEEQLRRSVKKFLERCFPYPSIVSLIMERGDPKAKEFVLRAADISGYSVLLEGLKAYAFSQYDPDEKRLEAARILNEHGVLPLTEVNLWLKGKWTPVLLRKYLVSGEPRPDPSMSPRGLELVEEAIEAMHAGQARRAEERLREALTLHPEHPGLLYNLAAALQLQGRNREAEKILDHVIEAFPDYFFGQIVRARRLVERGDLDGAAEVLKRLMRSREEFHTSEFSALCSVQIDLMLRRGDYETAEDLLKIWETVNPEDPNLRAYQSRRLTWR
jgi:tetratricopeptide (TPR) repeat protein